jgi:hypothetical protein
MNHPRRTCTRCDKPILRGHRWRSVWHKFLWWNWATSEHRDCSKPNAAPAVKRLKGEVPLSFGEPLTIHEVDSHGAA